MKKSSTFFFVLLFTYIPLYLFSQADASFVIRDSEILSVEAVYSQLAGSNLKLVGHEQLMKIVQSLKQITVSETGIPISDSKTSLGSAQYRLGPGDGVTLFIWGESIELSLLQNPNFPVSQNAVLNNEGALLIPNLGRFDLRGRTITEATEMVRVELAKKYKKFDLSLTLSQPRNMMVWVTGLVNKPGQLEVSPNSSLLEALIAAGGVLPSGSLRNITLYRPTSDKLEQVDLYPLLFTPGVQPQALADGDRVHVGPIGSTAAILGAVNISGIFEFKGSPSLQDLLSLAGGTGPFSSGEMRIISPSGKGFELSVVRKEANPSIVDGTLILVPRINTDFNLSSNIGSYETDFQISVAGAVASTGIFTMKNSSRLFDAIKAAGGYGPDAFPYGLILQRKSVKASQKEQSIRLSSKLTVQKSDLVRQLAQAKAAGWSAEALATINANIAQVDNYISELNAMNLEVLGGRISLVIPPTLEELEKDQLNNILLEAGDVITVPKRPTHVLVMGNTMVQSSFPHVSGRKVSEYLASAGGVNTTGNLEGIYILQSNGQVRSSSSSQGFLSLFRTHPLDMEVQPGDTIVVPEKIIGDMSWLALTNEVVSLLSSTVNIAVNSVQLWQMLR